MNQQLLSIAAILLVNCIQAQHHGHGHVMIPGKTVTYDLYVNDTIVNFTGKKRKAIATNGQLPAPTLYFTEGDTAVIRVHNEMKVPTSFHWHGILLPNEMDGVPFLNTARIMPSKTHTFTFPLIQSGTYWYHSHTMLQEQSGQYGALVIYPKDREKGQELVLLLSDWTDQNPHQVMRSLKRETDWYAIKKNAVQSWGEAIPRRALGAKIKQEWNRMHPMDVSDVYYDKFLINGKELSEHPDIVPGEKLRLRIVNGSASSYFWLQFAGGKMKVVAADGIDVQPVEVDKLLIAIAESYDVEVTVPDNGMAYELRATAQDVSGFASVFLGKGMRMEAPDIPELDYFGMMKEMGSMNMKNMDMDHGNMGSMDMPGMDPPSPKMPMDTSMHHMHHSMPMATTEVLSYDMLRSVHPTKLDTANEWRDVRLNLTGNMMRYTWSFNNKTLSRSDKILIKKGENVRFILHNETMMNHPMHLHGHFFRFINGQGDHAPLKHTVNIAPMETITIEFYPTFPTLIPRNSIYDILFPLGQVF